MGFQKGLQIIQPGGQLSLCGQTSLTQEYVRSAVRRYSIPVCCSLPGLSYDPPGGTSAGLFPSVRPDRPEIIFFVRVIGQIIKFSIIPVLIVNQLIMAVPYGTDIPGFHIDILPQLLSVPLIKLGQAAGRNIFRHRQACRRQEGSCVSTELIKESSGYPLKSATGGFEQERDSHQRLRTVLSLGSHTEIAMYSP